MHEKYFKLQEIYGIYQTKDQMEWVNFFTSSKSYFIKPAILVKKAAEVKFDVLILEKPSEKTENDNQKELENLVL